MDRQKNEKASDKDPRQQRLAEALRENLKRRKAQMRGRADQAAEQGVPGSGKAPGQNG